MASEIEELIGFLKAPRDDVRRERDSPFVLFVFPVGSIVVYNASNNELVRTKTLVKSAIIIDNAP